MTGWFRVALAVLLLGALAGATDYYLDALLGDDRNPGTSPEAPWQSPERLRRVRFAPGDRVFFRRGRVWHGGLRLDGVSGTKEAPVRVGAWGSGPPPRFDGTEAPSWTPLGGGLYRAPWPGAEPPGLLYYRGEPRPPLKVLRFPRPPEGLRPGAILLQLQGGYRAFQVVGVRGARVAVIGFFQVAPGVPVQVRQLEAGREVVWPEPLSPPEQVYDPMLLLRDGDWLYDPEERAVYLRSRRPPEEVGVRWARAAVGLHLVRSRYVEVSELAFMGFGQVGVWVQGSEEVVLRHLLVSGVGASGHKTGILLFSSERSLVQDSRVEDVMGNGIGVYARGPPESDAFRAVENRIVGNRVLRAGT